MPRVGDTEFAYTSDGAAKAKAYGNASGQRVDYGGANMSRNVEPGMAEAGRFGDSEMREVGGELAHVNPTEAEWIDQYGKEGEELVQKLGSGSINPETGQREYWFWVAAAVAAVLGYGAGAVRNKQQTGNWGSWDDAWDFSYGNQGLGDTISDIWGQETNPVVQKSRLNAINKETLKVEEDIERRGTAQLAPGGQVDQSYKIAAGRAAGDAGEYKLSQDQWQIAQDDYEMEGMTYGTGEFDADDNEIMASGTLGLASEQWELDQETAAVDSSTAWDKYLQEQATRTSDQYETGKGTVGGAYKMHRDYEAALRQTGMSESGALRKMMEGDQGLLESDYAASMVESKQANDAMVLNRDTELGNISEGLAGDEINWEGAQGDYRQAGLRKDAAKTSMDNALIQKNKSVLALEGADLNRMADVDQAIGAFDTEWGQAQTTYRAALSNTSKYANQDPPVNWAATGETQVPTWITEHLRPEGSAMMYEGWGFDSEGNFTEAGGA